MNQWLHRLKNYYRLWQLGYLQDQRGIMHRYAREKKYWDFHLERSKAFITDCARKVSKGHVVVLGSGWLLDVPLHELSSQFKKVTLVDIFHPASAKQQIAKYENVCLLEDDITGGMLDVLSKIRAARNIRPAVVSFLQPYTYTLPEDVDFVVSVNLLNQLDILLLEYLERHLRLSSAEKHRISAHIQQKHLQMLPRGKSCLISDVEEEMYDDNGDLAGTQPLIYVDLPNAQKTEQWVWKFDTQKMYNESFTTNFQVKALQF